jgi:hypothetical protein
MINDCLSFGRFYTWDTLVDQCKEEHELLKRAAITFRLCWGEATCQTWLQNGTLVLPVIRRKHFLSFFSFLAWRLVVLFYLLFLSNSTWSLLCTHRSRWLLENVCCTVS